MDIFFSPYTLLPLKKVNRLSSMDLKHGVFLKSQVNGKTTYADYFPHIALGDRGVDQFLAEFKTQNHECDQKLLHFLKKDEEYQAFGSTLFKNHQLWSGFEEVSSPVIKYKPLYPLDSLFLGPLTRGVTVRLDGNGLLTKDTLPSFLEMIPPHLLGQIEYMEDPSLDLDWASYPFKTARDFLPGTPFDVTVYKPNREFNPYTQEPTIFTGYLGSELGTWHAYCELIESGDLSLTHGLFGTNFYQEQKDLFVGDYVNGFMPNLDAVKDIYQDLSRSNWKSLCSV